MNPKAYLPFLMWMFPLLFFAYQFILRLWPSVMMHSIMHQFSIDATAFGVLASMYYYGYAGFQIPIAILLDRYSPRYVISGCAILCGLSMWAFVHTHSWPIALLSRFLIGVGSAVGFLGTSKVISSWFKPGQYARMVAVTFSLGLMGAIYGGRPVSLLVSRLGWQPVAMGLVWVSLGIGVCVFLFLRNNPHADPENTETTISLTGLSEVFRSPAVWLLAITTFLMVGPLEGFADVWGVSYLVNAYGMIKSDAAGLVSFIFVGMLLGAPILVSFSKRWGDYTVIALCGLMMAGALWILLYVPFLKVPVLGVLLFLIGIACCYQALIFSAGHHLVKPQFLGVTIAFLNGVNMLGGPFFHSLIGITMDAFWEGQEVFGLRQYSLVSYQKALGLIPICALLGTLLVVYLRRMRKVREVIS